MKVFAVMLDFPDNLSLDFAYPAGAASLARAPFPPPIP
jgi:hypothetical protein